MLRCKLYTPHHRSDIPTTRLLFTFPDSEVFLAPRKENRDVTGLGVASAETSETFDENSREISRIIHLIMHAPINHSVSTKKHRLNLFLAQNLLCLLAIIFRQKNLSCGQLGNADWKISSPSFEINET